jgi:uncharacterized protein YprB with RNaseH-like and TPR domain
MLRMRAYLDIETTFDGSISVIGIYRSDLGTIQLVGSGVHDLNLYRALEDVHIIHTYNGTCFDLPVIRRRLYIDLRQTFHHHDLMYACRERGLRGGLKKVELQLGIVRNTLGLGGWDAPRLWHYYQTTGDHEAFMLLLRYNQDDVIHLPRLQAYLEATLEEPTNEAVQIWSE